MQIAITERYDNLLGSSDTLCTPLLHDIYCVRRDWAQDRVHLVQLVRDRIDMIANEIQANSDSSDKQADKVTYQSSRGMDKLRQQPSC